MANNRETIRKIIATGIGAALLTEESLSKLISDIKLPRDAKNYLAKQAQRRKEDLSNIVARELKDFLKRINIHEELHKALLGLKIDVEGTVNISRSGAKLRLTKTRTAKPTTRRTKRRKR